MALRYIGKHIVGNSPKCQACKWYEERSEENKTSNCDGWCKRRGTHRKRNWNDFCNNWTEAETGLMYYEAVTGKLEAKRTPIEVIYYTELLKEVTK